MKKFIRHLLLVISVLTLLAGLAPPTYVYAATPPDSGPFITSVVVWRHYLEDDDMLVGVRYNVPYSSLPAETITDTYIGRFMDGTTEIARVAPFAYSNRGYRYGTFWMYLDTASAPAWSGNYTVELLGNPTLSWGGTPPYVSTTSLEWRSTSSHAATQALLRAYILTTAVDLGNLWTLVLVNHPATGSVLSSLGETYFVNAVPQLRTAVPNLFQQTVSSVQWADTTSNQTTINTLKGNWPFDWSGVSTWLGLPSEEVLTTIVFFVIVGIVIWAIGVRTKPEYGLFVMLLAIPIAAQLGMISIMWAGMIAFAFVFMIGFVLFIQKSGG